VHVLARPAPLPPALDLTPRPRRAVGRDWARVAMVKRATRTRTHRATPPPLYLERSCRERGVRGRRLAVRRAGEHLAEGAAVALWRGAGGLKRNGRLR